MSSASTSSAPISDAFKQFAISTRDSLSRFHFLRLLGAVSTSASKQGDPCSQSAQPRHRLLRSTTFPPRHPRRSESCGRRRFLRFLALTYHSSLFFRAHCICNLRTNGTSLLSSHFSSSSRNAGAESSSTWLIIRITLPYFYWRNYKTKFFSILAKGFYIATIPVRTHADFCPIS